MRTGGIVLAAGIGERYGGYKQFDTIDGIAVVELAFENLKGFCDEIRVATPPECLVNGYDFHSVVGGLTRWDSARIAFLDLPECDYVIVADAVRCNTSPQLIQRLLDKLKDFDCAFPVMPATETVIGWWDEEFTGFYNKHWIAYCQTPEVYRYDMLKSILEDFDTRPFDFILAHNVKSKGGAIATVPGEATNLKITWPIDLDIMRMIRERERVQ